MFKWKVKEVALSRGIMSAVQLAQRADIAPGTAVGLWYGRPLRIDLPTLERVCKALQCTPNDILELSPNEIRASARIPAAHAA